MNFQKAPKVELHLHLDCSLSYDVVKKIRPSVSLDEYNTEFIAPDKCIDLADYISRAKKGIDLMQTKEELRLVTVGLFENLKQDNVIYAEIRFAPLQHTEKGLTPEEVVASVNRACEEAIKKTGILGGIILCTLRHYTEAQGMDTVKLAEQFKGTNIIGFDLAADEAGFPVNEHILPFQFASKMGIHVTAHAGEAKGAESVWETLEKLNSKRIGHGVRSTEDKDLIDYLVKNNIHLEVCPTSNIQTNVFDTIEDHTIDKLYKAGVSMSINTDARSVSKVTLASEYELIEKTFNWNKEQFKQCNLAAIDHAFSSPEIKDELRRKIEAGY